MPNAPSPVRVVIRLASAAALGALGVWALRRQWQARPVALRRVRVERPVPAPVDPPWGLER
jgi:hypothetical protein